jgi:hypothetical protein
MRIACLLLLPTGATWRVTCTCQLCRCCTAGLPARCCTSPFDNAAWFLCISTLLPLVLGIGDACGNPAAATSPVSQLSPIACECFPTAERYIPCSVCSRPGPTSIHLSNHLPILPVVPLDRQRCILWCLWPPGPCHLCPHIVILDHIHT